MALVWTLIIAGLLAAISSQHRKAVRQTAITEARTYFQKDLAFRRWAASHGGVYVPITEQTPPNEYLSHIPERDIETPSGKKLTLINPAYMLRLLFEHNINNQPEINERITSLKLLNPANTSDIWENNALATFAAGKSEALEFLDLNGKPHLRLMQALRTGKECLKCHAHQGYIEGDVRGGISISLPMASLLAQERQSNIIALLSLGAIWLIGLGCLLVSRQVLIRRIDERNLAVEALQARESYLNTIIENQQGQVWLKDAENRFLVVNKAFAAYCGQGNPADLAGKTDLDIWPQELAEKYRQDDQEVMASKSSQRVIEPVHYQGQIRWLEIIRSPVVNEKGEVIGTTGCAHDITVRKEMEQRVIQQERLSAVGQLAAGIAHDFNNTLTSIIGFAELLHNSPEMPESARKDLSIIVSSGRRAAKLVSQMLDFSRKSMHHRQQLELAPLIKEIVKFLQRAIPESISIKLEIAPGDYLVHADPAQIQQILTNLALNAKDAMPSGGELNICLSWSNLLSARQCATCGQSFRDVWATLEVTDTGSGILPANLSRIFEPFFTTKEAGKGSGLGLAQVHGIVIQHGWHIMAQSEPGRGATFTVYFPLLLEPLNPDEVREVAPIFYGQGETILLVEDDPTVMTIMKTMLQELAYKVLTATNGREALAVHAEHQNSIALVLSDMVMPEMDGTTLFTTLKARQAGIKVVLMSASAILENARRLLEDGVAGWLSKPASLSVLSKILAKALGSCSFRLKTEGTTGGPKARRLFLQSSSFCASKNAHQPSALGC
jgi:PAS domain S-box-containing protein